MAGSVMLQSLCCITPQSPNCYKNQTLAFSNSQLFSSSSSFRLKKQTLPSAIRIKRRRTQNHRSVVPVATMGLVYFIFIALNKDEGPRGGGGTTSTPKEDGIDDSLEEARRIMEKYK
ncbi:hypothetical protein D8674_003079 [Pyrus ussuriensis x Pyrus communis]|uniref:Uncharacterized protein n=1 Tax=Pyrus ussuriensis x Pyrus communis TaxID=2448454 RepID=A0A5N5FUY2_9ROSA|nr:hypothetical protein D8674_003079 [Pyrus ussuriensis x Pyrus communis]